MSHKSELIATDIHAYLAQHEKKELLRFLTCGSVDDGKSTLIGKLLVETKMVYQDTLATLQKDSLAHGTTGGDFDPALLTDGLKAEREQGITIDVAYRYFSTEKRKYIIADTPGHEQYTRNMATGASTVDLAIILVDARNGVTTQTKRHSFIVTLLGIKHVLVAINKMDLVDYSEEVFERIKQDYTDFAARLEINDLRFVPLSALKGDNVVNHGDNMPWYAGSTVMDVLQSVHIASDANLTDFRFPVQYVNRPRYDFRGFCGTVASGIIRPGETVMALPSRKTTRVKSIVTFEGEREEAFPPLAVTLTLEDEIDVSRGDMLVRPGNVPHVDDTFDAMVVWMGEEPLSPGKPYLFKHTTKYVYGTVRALRHQVDVNTLHRKPASTLELNEIGRCEVALNQEIMFDAYRRNPQTGAFIVIDRISNVTVGAGMIVDRRPSETKSHWDDRPRVERQEHQSNVSHKERVARFGQRPVTLLLTGLSGSGKTSLAYALERRLFDEGQACQVLDGERMRRGISRDLGFTAEERSENLRRSAEIARLMNDAGLISICAFVAPSEEVRKRAAAVVGEDAWLVIHLAAPVAVCRQRDREGLYPAADAGEIPNFPGVSFEYEAPQDADLQLPTDQLGIDECVERVMQLLQERNVL